MIASMNHNPAPSTPRGKRRHAARSEEAKAHAARMWAGGRKTPPPTKKGTPTNAI